MIGICIDVPARKVMPKRGAKRVRRYQSENEDESESDEEAKRTSTRCGISLNSPLFSKRGICLRARRKDPSEEAEG